MRTIEIETSVFAAIWSARRDDEETENDILKRLLYEVTEERRLTPSIDPSSLSERGHRARKDVVLEGKVRWIDDVKFAFEELGGRAFLDQIYLQVREQRRMAGRSLPRSLEAIVRRSIEEQSSDSEAFKGNEDLFEHISRGEWALR